MEVWVILQNSSGKEGAHVTKLGNSSGKEGPVLTEQLLEEGAQVMLNRKNRIHVK